MKKISFAILSLIFVLFGIFIPNFFENNVYTDQQVVCNNNIAGHNMIVEYDNQDQQVDNVKSKDNSKKVVTIVVFGVGGIAVAGLVVLLIIKSKKV